jgi:hypothetical protein
VNPPLPVHFTLRASRQVAEAERWWRDNRTKAPDALRDELEQALKLIATQPEVGARAQNAKLASVRRILIRRVRYHLYYRLWACRIHQLRFWPCGTRAEAKALTYEPPNLALQLTSGELVVARLRARHHSEGPLAAERGC